MGPGATLTFDSFNAFILKGDAAQGLPLLFDSLMVRAYDEPDAVYGLIARSVVRAPDGLSITFQHAARGQVRRRHAGDVERRRVHAEDAQGEGASAVSPRAARRGRRDRRRAAYGALRLQGQADARPAADRGHAAGAVGGVLCDAHLRHDDAGAAARLGALCDRRLQAGHLRHLQAAAGLLGQGPAGQSRPAQLRRGALRVFPRPHGLAGEPEGWRLRPARGVHRQGLVDRLRRAAGQGWAAGAGHAARREPVGRAGVLHQHPQVQVLRPARAQGAQLRVRLRVDQSQPVLQSLHPHQQLLRELAAEGGGQALQGGAGRCSSRSATSCRRRCSTTRSWRR